MAKCQAGTSSFRKCSKLLKPWLLTNKDCVYLCAIRAKSCAIDFQTKSVLTQNENFTFGLKVDCTWSGPKSLSKIKSVCKLHCTHRVRTDFKCKLMNQNFWLQNIKIYYRNSRKSWILKPENYVILGRVISSEMYTFGKKK